MVILLHLLDLSISSLEQDPLPFSVFPDFQSMTKPTTFSPLFIHFMNLFNSNNNNFEIKDFEIQDFSEIINFLSSNHSNMCRDNAIDLNKKQLRQVLKKVLEDFEKRLEFLEEAEEIETVEDLQQVAYELMGDLCMPSSSPSAATLQEKIYFMPNSFTMEGALILTEQVAMISAGTTGLSTWNASLWLLEYLSSPTRRNLVKGKSVVELGSGCGLLGLALAKYLGAKSVLLTDCDYSVLERLKKNQVRNGLPDDVIRIEKWDWVERARCARNKHNQEEFDVLVAADVVFDPSLIAPLVATIAATKTQCCLIACTERVKDTFAFFTKHLNEAGLLYTLTTAAPANSSTWFYYHEKSPVHLVEIWRER